MSDDPTSINVLKNCTIKRVETDPDKQGYYRFIGKYGLVLFSVEKDSIFDRHGNYFEDDTP